MKIFLSFIYSIFLLISVNALASDVKNYSNSESLKLQSDDLIIGDNDAPLTLIEYSSLTCPHCANFHKDAYEEIKKKYIETKLVKYVYRDYPTNPPALFGALLSHCAGKDKYYAYINALMRSQSIWAFHHNFKESLINVGKLGGMTESNINSCFTDKVLEDKLIKRAANSTKELNIEATPSYFLNGDKHTGAKSAAEWSKIIDAKLNVVKSK